MNKRKRKKLLRIAIAKGEVNTAAEPVEELKDLPLGLKELKVVEKMEELPPSPEVVEVVAEELPETVVEQAVTEAKPTKKKKV